MNGGPSQQKGTVADPFAVANTGHPQDPFASAPYQSAPVDTPDPENSYGMRLATHVLNTAQGIPGMEAFQAFMGMLGSRVPGNVPQTYGESLQNLRSMTGNIPRAESVGERLGGSLATLPFLPSNPAMAGGLLMGGQAALQADPITSEEDLAKRAGETAVGFGAGYAMPWLTTNPVTRTLIGAGAGAAVAPSGHRVEGGLAGGTLAASAPWLTRQIAQRAPGILGDLADALTQASGKTGEVNKELAGMQRIQSGAGGGPIGSAPPASNRALATAEKFYGKARTLYDQARGDKTVLNDPQIMALVKDPDLIHGWRSVVALRDAAKNPLPEMVTGSRDIASPILHASGVPFTKTEPITEAVPDPAALHTLKRIVADVVNKGYSKDSPISLEDALRMEPKLAELRTLLHTRSRDYAMADQFYQAGKTAETGVDLGYGAAKPGMRNPTTGALTEKTPTAAKQFVADQPSNRLRAVASSAVRRGAQDQMLQQIGAKPLDAGRSGVLAAPILQMSGPAAEQRGLALGPNARTFEDLLGSVRTESAADKPGGLLGYLHERVGPMYVNLHPRETPPLETPTGQNILSDVIRNPAAYQRVLGQYAKGKAIRDALLRTGGLLGNALIP